MTRSPGANFNWPKFAISDARQVLDPAAELFASRGFQNVTMDELAAEIGVAKGTLYSYVGNKHKVLEAIFDQFLFDAEELLTNASRLASFEERVRYVMRSWIGSSPREQAYHRVYYGQFSHLPASVQRDVRRRADKFTTMVRDFVIEGQRNGEVAEEFDSTMVAMAIVRVCTASGQGLGASSRLDWAEAAEQFAAIVTMGVAHRS